MSAVKVVKIGEEGIKDFVLLPFALYKGDPNWVAPLIKDQIKLLKGGSRFLRTTEHDLLMGFRDGKPCARAIVGRYSGMSTTLKGSCYFSQLEASDPESFKAIIASIEEWAAKNGLKVVQGPCSPTDGEDDRGFLTEGFDGPPTLMGTYNKRWYPEEMDKLGYTKDMDLYTFLLTGEAEIDERLTRALELSLKRSKADVSHIHVKDPEDDFRAMHEIVLACAAADSELPTPSWEHFKSEAMSLAKLADERLIWIARRHEDRKPIAFVVSMPNWAEILQKMRGRLFPLGWIYAIGAKKRIRGMRALIQYCIPEYHGSGIMSVLYMKVFEQAKAAGYTYGEAGIIKDDNYKSRRPIEAIGGKHYRTYRRYTKSI